MRYGKSLVLEATMDSNVFSATSGRPHALQRALVENRFLVVGLCAAWCGTCTEFRSGFNELADARRDATFVWLDIEDDAEIAGDIDVENFPTIAIFNDGRLLHYGVSVPHASIVARLLAALNDQSRTIPAEPAVVGLPERLTRQSVSRR